MGLIMKGNTLNKVSICSNKSFRNFIIEKSNIKDEKTIAVAYWETPALYYDIKRRYPEKDVYYIDVEENKDIYGFIENAIYVKSEEEFPNMNFDKVIMNPPYGGKSNLYIRITAEVKRHADEVICLSPVLDYYNDSNRKEVINAKEILAQTLKSYEYVSGKGFDASFDKDLYILTFGNTNNPIDFSKFRFDKFNNKQLAKDIYKKLEVYNNKFISLYIGGDFTKYKFNCYVSHIRGHRNQETGKLLPDWTTLFNPSIKYEFEKYKGNAVGVEGFGFNTEEECINFVNYCDSDIIMFSIYMYKTSFNNGTPLYKKLPAMPTYTKAWTDEEIAQELGLTDEEVAYIHEEMKDFGYKAMKNSKEI